jgi:hypothetical protein
MIEFDVILFSVIVSNLNLCFAAVQVNVVWNEIVAHSVTTPTLQVTI